MHKTTLYLSEGQWRELRERAASIPGANLARLIRQALADYLRRPSAGPEESYLKKHLRKRAARGAFGDGVAYQRRLRGEWN